MKLRIYIAGKITGENTEECKTKFHEAGILLRSLSVETVINPLKLGIPPSWTWSEAKEICLKVLKKMQTQYFFFGIGLTVKVHAKNMNGL